MICRVFGVWCSAGLKILEGVQGVPQGFKEGFGSEWDCGALADVAVK